MATIGTLSIAVKLTGVAKLKKDLASIGKQLDLPEFKKLAKNTEKLEENFKRFSSISKEIDQNLRSVSSALRQTGSLFQSVGREVRNVSGAFVGVFAGAFANARQELPQVDAQLKEIQNTFKALSVSLAQAALPTLQEFVTGLNKVAHGIQDFVKNNRDLVNQFLKFSGISLVIGIALIAVGKFIAIGAKLISTFLAIKKAIETGFLIGFGKVIAVLIVAKTLFDAITGKLLTLQQAFMAFAKGGLPGLGAMLGAKEADKTKKDMDSLFSGATKNVKKLMDAIKNASGDSLDVAEDRFGRFVRGLQSGFKTLGEAFEGFGQSIRQSLETALGDTIFDAITGRLKGLRAILKSLGEDILRSFSRMASNQIIGLLMGGQGLQGQVGPFGAGGLLGGILGGFGGKGGPFGALKGTSGTKVGGVGGAEKQAENQERMNEEVLKTTDNLASLQQAKDRTINNFNVLTTALDTFKTMMQTFLQGLAQNWSAITNFVASAWQQAMSIVIQAAQTLMAIVASIGKKGGGGGFFGSLLGIGGAILGNLILPGIGGLLGGALGGITKIAGGILGGGGGFPGGHIPQITMAAPALMQHGGIIRKPTLGMMGEAGPEAVVPLDKAGMMGNINITINADTILADDDTSINRMVRTLVDGFIRETQRRTGGTAIVL